MGRSFSNPIGHTSFERAPETSTRITLEPGDRTKMECRFAQVGYKLVRHGAVVYRGPVDPQASKAGRPLGDVHGSFVLPELNLLHLIARAGEFSMVSVFV